MKKIKASTHIEMTVNTKEGVLTIVGDAPADLIDKTKITCVDYFRERDKKKYLTVRSENDTLVVYCRNPMELYRKIVKLCTAYKKQEKKTLPKIKRPNKTK